jgi:RNA polymerase sigma-70 factor (ECF subfamily)
VTDQPSDEELLTRHLDGDRNAFTTLVSRHERRVYAICMRMLGNAEDAQDAAQEAFISVLRRAGTFKGGAAFTTWLYRVAVNAAIDQARKRGKVKSVPLGEQVPAHHGADSGDPGDTVSASVTVQAALARLPAEFRSAVVLCDLCRLPYNEAAEALGVPVGTVKSRVFRGRAALASELHSLDPRRRATGRQAALATLEPVTEPGTESGTSTGRRPSDGPSPQNPSA